LKQIFKKEKIKMGDHHGHQHTIDSKKMIHKAFIVVIELNSLFVVIEFIVGLIANSLSLLSDAGHNLSDVVSLVLALLAFRLSQVKRIENYTYGLQKSTILVALANAIILIFVVVGIIWEAMDRIGKPVHTEGNIIALVAFIGLIINGVTALFFFREKENDLNIKGAYMHMASDALVSLAVCIGGIVILFTDLYWIDSVLSILVAVVILIGTWKLLQQTVRLSLDGVPHGINLKQVAEVALAVDGVKGIHHIHIWAISTTQNALTAHITLEDYREVERIKTELKHQWEHLKIQHSTIEFELNACETFNCDAKS
jgi:cobalt-zinc-cadmium efflux system protein